MYQFLGISNHLIFEDHVYSSLFEKDKDIFKVWKVGFGNGKSLFNFLLPLIYIADQRKINSNRIIFYATDSFDIPYDFQTCPYIGIENLKFLPKKYHDY